jgi:hypothetical protein
VRSHNNMSDGYSKQKTAKYKASIMSTNILSSLGLLLLVLGFLVLSGIFVIGSLTNPNRAPCARSIGDELGNPFTAAPNNISSKGTKSFSAFAVALIKVEHDDSGVALATNAIL